MKGSGPISCVVLRLLGYRLTCVLGSLLSTASFILTWLLMHLGVTSILPFYPVTGGMAGLGLGLLYMVARAVINVSGVGDKRMGLATGLASSGSGMGQLALAPLLVLAMDRVGLSLTFLMLGAVTGSGALLGLTLTTPNKKEKMQMNEGRLSILQFI